SDILPVPAFLQDFCKGKIYIMYHGTSVMSAIQILTHGFQQSADGMLGRGVYVTRDRNKAAGYPYNNIHDQVILKLRVSVGRVKKIERDGHPLQKTWHDHGYNTAWVPPHCGMVRSGFEEDCVWNPNRIKVVGIEKAPPMYLPCLQQLLLTHNTQHSCSSFPDPLFRGLSILSQLSNLHSF
uniref:PARP catalytic domain-containing protein n=1 Tax=Leptobrachium leishanense TaxID=445787 RepID=A0A8C5PFK4_9ANUR